MCGCNEWDVCSSGATRVGDHPLPSVLEAACTALWTATSAQLLSESIQQRTPPAQEAPPAAGQPTAVKIIGKSNAPKNTSALNSKAGAGNKACGSSDDHANKLQHMTWRDMSMLARLAGQVIAVLQKEQVSSKARPHLATWCFQHHDVLRCALLPSS